MLLGGYGSSASGACAPSVEAESERGTDFGRDHCDVSPFLFRWRLGAGAQNAKTEVPVWASSWSLLFFAAACNLHDRASGRAASASGNPDFSGTLRGGRNGGRNAFVKKYFKNESRCDIISTIKYYKGGVCHETHQNFKYKKLTEYNEKRRMRRVPDILSVCMQDILYSRKSELRTYKIKCVQHCSAVSGEIRRLAAVRSEKQCSRIPAVSDLGTFFVERRVIVQAAERLQQKRIMRPGSLIYQALCFVSIDKEMKYIT